MKTRAEKRWLWIFVLLLVGFTTAPYLLGYASQGENWTFTGFVFGTDDGNSYIAKMLSGAEGAWLFKTPYTPYPQDGVLAFLPYLLLGKFSTAARQHEQLLILFHAFRVLGGILAILATYDFFSIFIKNISGRRWALVIATLGGGLGWVLFAIGRSDIFGEIPLEFYSPESFGFLSIFGLPHLAFARALLLWGLASYLKQTPIAEPWGEGDGGQKFWLWLMKVGAPKERWIVLRTGLLFLILGFFQPLTVLVSWLILTAHTLGILLSSWLKIRYGERGWVDNRWGTIRRVAWIFFLSSPLVLYTFWSFSRDPFLRAWTGQNLILSPHPGHYLLAFGILLPFSLLGIRPLTRIQPWRGWFPITWLLLFPLLAYAPFNLQRRLPEGIWVTIVLLGYFGVERLISQKDAFRRLKAVILLLVLPSTAILVLGSSLAAMQPGIPVFRPAGEVAAFEFLASRGEKDALVLASFATGNALPAWAPMRVVLGHGPESINFEPLEKTIHDFYSLQTTNEKRREWLRDLGVDYVFWGPREKQLGSWEPAQAHYMVREYQEGDYAIFSVRLDP